MSPDVRTKRLESPEETQMYCSDSILIHRTVYEVQMYINICLVKRRNLDKL